MRGSPAPILIAGAIALAIGGCHIGIYGAVAGVAGAQRPYVPERIAVDIGSGSVRTIGCLDVGLVPFQRAEASFVDLHVGNRCPEPEALDMTRLVIRARDVEGGDRDVALRDPRSEIALVHVGGAERGRERLRLEGASDAVHLCFHVERVVPRAPAARPRPLCFGRAGDRWRPEPG